MLVLATQFYFSNRSPWARQHTCLCLSRDLKFYLVTIFSAIRQQYKYLTNVSDSCPAIAARLTRTTAVFIVVNAVYN